MNFRRMTATLLLLCLCLFRAEAQKGTRGIVSLEGSPTPFAAKGSWIIGGSVSGNSGASDNYRIAVLGGIDSRNYGFSISPEVSYAIADDLSVGISGFYNRSFSNLASLNLETELFTLDIRDYEALRHNYGAYAFCRKYLTLGNSGRFALYVDAQIGMSAGQGKIRSLQDGAIIGSFHESYCISLGVNPGLAMSVTDRFAIKAGLGIAGISYSWEKQSHNQVASGSACAFGASYIVNPLTLSIGACLYL